MPHLWTSSLQEVKFFSQATFISSAYRYSSYFPTWQFIFVFHLSLMKPVDINPNEEWINVSVLDEVHTQGWYSFSNFPALLYFHLTCPHPLPLCYQVAMAGISPQIRILFINIVFFPLGNSCSYVLLLNSLLLYLKSKLKCYNFLHHLSVYSERCPLCLKSNLKCCNYFHPILKLVKHHFKVQQTSSCFP